jgi:hypothetical protein
VQKGNIVEWISTKNEPLPFAVPALVTYKKYNNELGYACVERYWLAKDRNIESLHIEGVSGYDYWLDFELHEITHWMPLPQPPKE